MSTSDLERQVAAAFASDVTHHRMVVKLDQGLHRHLVFQQREHSWNCHFELITAPGSLTITGDHGSYVFRRMTDMFQFFRGNGNEHSINPSYWAEKLPDAGRSVRVYSEQTTRALLDEALADWEQEYPGRLAQYTADRQRYDATPADARWPYDRNGVREPEEIKAPAECRELITEHERWGAGLDHEDGARELLRELEQISLVSDTWEWNLADWDYHFLWCLHAIAWGVRQYDAAVQAGLHVVRPGPVAWDVPLPTTAPQPPEPKGQPAEKVETVLVAGGVL